MDVLLKPPALPQHSDLQPQQEGVADPVAALGMVALMALMWLAGWLVLSPIWTGSGMGPSLRDMQQKAFTPLPVVTRLPQILIAEPEDTKATDVAALNVWDDGRQQAEYVAGALVEDEVQGVLLKLHLIAETGKFVGRLVSEK